MTRFSGSAGVSATVAIQSGPSWSIATTGRRAPKRNIGGASSPFRYFSKTGSVETEYLMISRRLISTCTGGSDVPSILRASSGISPTYTFSFYLLVVVWNEIWYEPPHFRPRERV